MSFITPSGVIYLTDYMNYGPFLIFIAAVLWGVDGLLRSTLYSLPPATIVFYEHLIGLAIIAPFFIRAMKGEKLNKLEWSAIILVALFSGALGTLAFTAALLKTNFIPFTVVYLIQKLQPIFTIFTASLVLREKLSPKYFVWAAVALVAGYFVTFPGGVVNFGAGSDYIVAAFLAFLAAVMWGSSTAFSRYTLLGHSSTYITGLRYLITVPIAFALVLGFGAASSLATISTVQFLTLVAIALSTGAFALWLYYRGLKTVPASVSTIIELAFPLTAVVIDAFRGTFLTSGQYIAGAILLFAMYQVSRIMATPEQSVQ